MAGDKLKYRVEASTILEVIISMVVILVVFTIAMMISTNVVRSSLSVKKIKAQALLQETLARAEQNKENNSQIFTVDDFKIEEKTEAYDNNPALTEIDLVAFDTNQDTVAKLQKVIINQNETPSH
jgi:Tfp pilus assembly protein PilE